MKKHLFFLLSLILLGCTNENDIGVLNSKTLLTKTDNRRVITVTMEFSFGRDRDVSEFYGSLGGWIYYSQAHVSTDAYDVFGHMSGFSLMTVKLYNVDALDGSNSVDVYLGPGVAGYSDFFNALRRSDTYVDSNSFKVYPMSLFDQYKFVLNVVNLDCHPIPNTGVEITPPSTGRISNRISLQWNTTNNAWDIVSQYPVTSRIPLLCAGPDTPGTRWYIEIGTSRTNTNISVPSYAIDNVSISNDDTYDYVY